MKKSEKNKRFSPKTAGSLMTIQVPLVSKEKTIEEVQNLLFKKMKDFETINYIYVVDEKGNLIGVFSIKEVFRKRKNLKINDIMKKEIIKCRVSTDQEKVAVLSLKNNLKAIPVVGKENKFLGVIASDTILSVLHQENVEDILMAGGISKLDNSFKALVTADTSTLVKIRLPWLLFGLLGGVFAAQIIAFFEETLQSQIILALFIPIIVYMSDAVATQTETLIIRGIAINSELNLRKYFLREIKVGSLLALILGGILTITSFLWWQESVLSIILGLSLFLGIFISVIVATLIPLILQKFKKDPAFGSGPFATIITDILSITIYFLIANLLFKIL